MVACRLQFYKDIAKFRILCCGGDGTVGWLLEAMGAFVFIVLAPHVVTFPYKSFVALAVNWLIL